LGCGTDHGRLLGAWGLAVDVYRLYGRDSGKDLDEVHGVSRRLRQLLAVGQGDVRRTEHLRYGGRSGKPQPPSLDRSHLATRATRADHSVQGLRPGLACRGRRLSGVDCRGVTPEAGVDGDGGRFAAPLFSAARYSGARAGWRTGGTGRRSQVRPLVWSLP
jgi:hypothetical protein